jgi:hypothetical protein
LSLVAALAIAACSAESGDGEGRPPRFRDAYFNALFAEHCLRADQAANAADAQRERGRLAKVRRKALAMGLADEVRAAEQRWADFAARAEFVCELSAVSRLRLHIDQLIRLVPNSS